MLSSDLAGMYERDILRVAAEISAFTDERNLWRTAGSIRNPAGNLALHIAGGLNRFIGGVLGGTGYVRDRDREFGRTGVPRAEIIDALQQLASVARDTIGALAPAALDDPFPVFFDHEGVSTRYVLTQLLLHTNYHLGQINYLRRMLET